MVFEQWHEARSRGYPREGFRRRSVPKKRGYKKMWLGKRIRAT